MPDVCCLAPNKDSRAFDVAVLVLPRTAPEIPPRVRNCECKDLSLDHGTCSCVVSDTPSAKFTEPKSSRSWSLRLWGSRANREGNSRSSGEWCARNQDSSDQVSARGIREPQRPAADRYERRCRVCPKESVFPCPGPHPPQRRCLLTPISARE